jgi:CPA1 family monovalent cation:H+ antiporter
MPSKTRFSPQTVKVLVWGGIRGGVSIALALSIPKNENSTIVLSITYCVVVFSIIVQGLTIGKLANPKKIANEEESKESVTLDNID